MTRKEGAGGAEETEIDGTATKPRRGRCRYRNLRHALVTKTCKTPAVWGTAFERACGADMPTRVSVRLCVVVGGSLFLQVCGVLWICVRSWYWQLWHDSRARARGTDSVETAPNVCAVETHSSNGVLDSFLFSFFILFGVNLFQSFVVHEIDCPCLRLTFVGASHFPGIVVSGTPSSRCCGTY